MKIIYVCPGTGTAFYCENCMRDHALITGLRAIGHEVFPVACYLPIEETDAAGARAPITFGAVNMYLKSKYPALKKFPRFFLRLLDSRYMLNIAARFASSTRATGHEQMTLDMLTGVEGPFADEFDAMTDVLLQFKPDAVILPNAMMLGVASAIKAKSPQTKVTCFLHDEHVWVDLFASPYCEQTWNLIGKKTKFADKLCAHSNWYRQKIAPRINVTPSDIEIVPIGVIADKYTNANSQNAGTLSIGYLSRVCTDLGADVLTDGYCDLLKENVCAPALSFCGGYTKDDAQTIKSIRKKVAGVNGRVIFHKHFDIASRVKFLSAQTVLCVPAKIEIAFGAFIVEAMAAGVPVVMPNRGGFGEVIEETGAGILYDPNTRENLTDALKKVLRDKNLHRSLIESGARAVREKYNHISMSDILLH